VLYAATGAPADPDTDPGWAARVRAHQERRPPWWETWEGEDLPAVLSRPGAPVLVDSLGTWLAGALDRSGCWEQQDSWRQRLDTETDALVHAWRQTPRITVAVAEEVGAGVIPATAAGRLFRDLLGALTRRIAAESERVLVVAAGRIVHRTGTAGRITYPAGTAGKITHPAGPVSSPAGSPADGPDSPPRPLSPSPPQEDEGP
jgi:adenosylcobinamide kinase / adenosylcobinamide-phosphate guanylyltransferase